jgi:hypothetical protein
MESSFWLWKSILDESENLGCSQRYVISFVYQLKNLLISQTIICLLIIAFAILLVEDPELKNQVRPQLTREDESQSERICDALIEKKKVFLAALPEETANQIMFFSSQFHYYWKKLKKLYLEVTKQN